MAGNNFLSQPKYLRNLVTSLNSQPAWSSPTVAAPLADSALTMRQRFDGTTVLELVSTRRSDLAYAGKGTAFATDGQITSWETKLNNAKSELSPALAGWALAFLCGLDVVTTAEPAPVLASLAGTLAVANATDILTGTLSGVQGDGHTAYSITLGTGGATDTLANLLHAINVTHAAYGITATLNEAGTQMTFAATSGDSGSPTMVGAGLTDALAPGIYTHSFAFDESTRTAVPTTIYVEDTEDVKYKCPDMVVNDLTLTIDEIGAIMLEYNMIGCGWQVMGAMESVPALAAQSYLLGSDAALNFGPVGSTASFLGRHMKSVIKLSNECLIHRAPGGELYGIFVRKQNPTFSVSTTIAAKDTDDTYTLFRNDTASDYELAVNSGASAQLTVSVPKARFKSTKLGFDGEMIVWQLDADQSTAFCTPGVTPPISLTVTNNVAGYLAAPES
jgi:hypothetical protein